MGEEGRRRLERLRSRLGFVLSNPPTSRGDDGFGFRRRVLRDVAGLLALGGAVFLSISSHYGHHRVEALTSEAPGFRHAGILESTPPAPFDLDRPDLRAAMCDYLAEEARGGPSYQFVGPDGSPVPATEAFEVYRTTGRHPSTRWQVHLFERTN